MITTRKQLIKTFIENLEDYQDHFLTMHSKLVKKGYVADSFADVVIMYFNTEAEQEWRSWASWFNGDKF